MKNICIIKMYLSERKQKIQNSQWRELPTRSKTASEQPTHTEAPTETQDLFNLLFPPIVEGFSAEQQKNNSRLLACSRISKPFRVKQFFSRSVFRSSYRTTPISTPGHHSLTSLFEHPFLPSLESSQHKPRFRTTTNTTNYPPTTISFPQPRFQHLSGIN